MIHGLYRFGMALMMGIVLFSGCSNPLTGKPETGEAPENRGVVQIQVGSPAARTLQPALTEFSKYELDFAGSSGASHAQEVITSGSATVELSPGAWTITVTAYTGTGDGAKKAATGNAPVTVSAGQTTNAAITLSPYTGEGAEQGTFAYTVAYPANLAEAKLYLTTADGTALSDGTIDLLGEDKRTGSRALDAGSYGIQVRLKAKDDLIAGKTESLHIYPALTTSLNYTFTAADFVAFAEVGNVTVAGTAAYDDPGTAATGEVVISLYNEGFKEAILEEDGETVKAWFQNLPAGLSVAPKSAAATGAQGITLNITGTPTEPSSEELIITIPGEVLESGKALTVRSNPEAKFAIGLPAASASVGDAALAGETGKALAWTVTVTLKNAAFTAIAGDASLTGWFNLPQGLSAAPSAAVAAGAKAVTVSISGTVGTAVERALLAINIPADALDRGADLEVAANANAAFAITDPPPKAVYIAGNLQDTYGGPNTAKYWKYTTGGALSLSESLEDQGDSQYTGIAVDSQGNVHLVGSMVKDEYSVILYQKNDVLAKIGRRNSGGRMGLAPDDKVYMSGAMRDNNESLANVPRKYWEAVPGSEDPPMVMLGTRDIINNITGIAADDAYIYLLGTLYQQDNFKLYRIDRTNLNTITSQELVTSSWAGTNEEGTPGSLILQAMVLQGDAIHIAGYVSFDDFSRDAHAWYLKLDKTSGAVLANIKAQERSHARGITVSESGEAYLAGFWKEPLGFNKQFYKGTAMYWKVENNTLVPHDLISTTVPAASDDTNYAEGTSIALDGEDVYIAGYSRMTSASAAPGQPVYWKDPRGSGDIQTIQLETMTTNSTTSQVLAIAVR
ncbi:MAG: hypothetical protein LBG24_11290 [Treponema sp.]|nr:hypothetical protein [Treponema sp.]